MARPDMLFAAEHHHRQVRAFIKINQSIRPSAA
jgi:hypothetical protein